MSDKVLIYIEHLDLEDKQRVADAVATTLGPIGNEYGLESLDSCTNLTNERRYCSLSDADHFYRGSLRGREVAKNFALETGCLFIDGRDVLANV